MQKIAVFFDQPNFADYPFSEKEYHQSYHEFAQLITQKGGQFFIARGDSTYLGEMKFTKGWIWNESKFEPTKELGVDVIYDKSNSARIPPFRFDRKAKILNPNPVVEVCNDKFKTYQLFKEFSPRLEIALDQNQLIENLAKIEGAQKVVKPLNAEGGEGVVIGDDQTILDAPKEFPVLVQEFIDTSSGIAEIDGIDSHHDFRIIMINGEIIQAFVRTPPTGRLTANIAQGGSSHEIELEEIPNSARELTKKVDTKFTSYPRVYSIDLGFDQKGEPKLIELNSQPALFSKERGSSFAHFQEKLAEVLLSFKN